MASKTYIVMKDGEILKELKNLSVAKKLADTEDAKVFSEGLCVYALDPVISMEGEAFTDDVPVEHPSEKKIVTGASATKNAKQEETSPQKYVLTAKMNIRKAPSMDARRLGIAKKGTIVEATLVENGWLHLTDGTYILYEGGKFAEKC